MAESGPNGQSPDDSPRPRPFQFSLRTLLLVPIVVALFFAFIVGIDLPLSWAVVSLGTLLAIGLLGSYVWAVIFRRTWAPLGLCCGLVLFWGFSWTFSRAIPPYALSRIRCNLEHLQVVGIGLRAYHNAYGCFPPAYVADANGRPMHSWRVLILPFLGYQALYRQYRFDEPWNSPNNRRVTGVPIPVFQCPEESDPQSQTTSYLAVVGPGTIWPGAGSVALSEVADGPENTLLLVEVRNSGVRWAEPRDLEVAQLDLGVNPEQGLGVSSWHAKRNWFARPAGAHVGLADWSTRFLGNQTSPEMLRGMATINGGEIGERED